jgi:hypothetical protein
MRPETKPFNAFEIFDRTPSGLTFHFGEAQVRNRSPWKTPHFVSSWRFSNAM